MKPIFQWMRYRKIRFLLVILTCLTAPLSAATKNGFITNISTPMAFDVGTLHVVMNAQTKCETGMLEYDIETKQAVHSVILAWEDFILQQRPTSTSIISKPCDALSLNVGSRVSLIGDIQPGSEIFASTHVVLYTVQNRKIITLVQNKKELKWAGLLEENPQVHQTAQGWIGKMWLDGYPMSVTPLTRFLAAPADTRIVYDFFGWSFYNSHPQIRAESRATSSIPVFSRNLFQPNTWVFYHAAQAADGSINATQLRLWPNQVNIKEKKYWKQFAAKIQPPSYSSHSSGSIKFKHLRAIQILPDQAVQNWVSKLGMELIPPYQKSLPETDASKIHFSFYVVQATASTLHNEAIMVGGLRALKNPNFQDVVVAMPSGLILIPNSTLSRIHNKAQLAAILSYAITTVLQKHAYFVSISLRNTGNADWGAYAQGSFAIFRNEQKLRIGIRQMYLAGYDIREAPFAWAVAQGKPVNNPVIDSKHPDKEIPWYAAYAFNYISHYYKGVDYSKLKRGEREYQQFLQELYKADPSLQHPKVATTPASKK